MTIKEIETETDPDILGYEMFKQTLWGEKWTEEDQASAACARDACKKRIAEIETEVARRETRNPTFEEFYKKNRHKIVKLRPWQLRLATQCIYILRCNGAPGTGKTTILRLLQEYDAAGHI